MTTPQEPAPDTETEVTPGDVTENPSEPDEDGSTGTTRDEGAGEVSEAQSAGPVSDGDAPTGDPDLAEGEQPDPATEPAESDDQQEG